MPNFRVMIWFLSVVLLVGLAGCASAPPDEPERVDRSLSVSLDAQENREAVEVLEHHLRALAAGDLDTLLETTPAHRHSIYVDNPKQIARWNGFQVEFVSLGGGWISEDEVAAQYEGRGYKRIAIFHITGRFPKPRSDDVLPEEFDVIMIQDASGRWMINDMGH